VPEKTVEKNWGKQNYANAKLAKYCSKTVQNFPQLMTTDNFIPTKRNYFK